MATGWLELRGRRGWLAVAGLTLALSATVAAQAQSSVAHADLSPVAATSDLSPTVTTPTADPTANPTADAAVTPASPVTPAPPAAPAPQRVAAPTPPVAATADRCSSAGWQDQRGRAALASLRDNGRRSGVTVSFKPARAGYLGLTYPALHHVDVFVRDCGAESTALLRHVVSHEMGHAYDAAHMTSARRAAYEARRGIPAGTPWFGCSYCTDFATPAGDFAETYSQWQRGSHDSRTRMAPMPGSTQLASLAAAFFQA
jgi:hypothetical protein